MIAYYVVWNEAEQIAKSIRSVKAYVDGFAFLDIAFDSNPTEATHSTDTTRKVVYDTAAPLPVTYIESDVKMREDEARSRLMRWVPDGEWMIGLDGDEVLYAKHDDMLELTASLATRSEDILQLRVYTTAALGYVPANGTEAQFQTAPVISSCGWAPRILRNKPGLHVERMQPKPDKFTYGGIWLYDKYVGNLGPHLEQAFIVNDHAAQSFAGYQYDHAWESLQRTPA